MREILIKKVCTKLKIGIEIYSLMIQTCKQYDSIESQLKVFFYKDIHLFTYMYATL